MKVFKDNVWTFLFILTTLVSIYGWWQEGTELRSLLQEERAKQQVMMDEREKSLSEDKNFLKSVKAHMRAAELANEELERVILAHETKPKK